MIEQTYYRHNTFNVLGVDDRVGGNHVLQHEYEDIQEMMRVSGLFACQTIGDMYTWSNRHRGPNLFKG